MLKIAFKNTDLLPEIEYTCCPKQNRKTPDEIFIRIALNL